MGNQIYFKIAGQVDLDVLIIFTPFQIFDIINESQPNFAEMILKWSPFKIVSVSAVLYPRWPPLLKIEISSNGQNCSSRVGRS
jgi:hypothetical protein